MTASTWEAWWVQPVCAPPGAVLAVVVQGWQVSCEGPLLCEPCPSWLKCHVGSLAGQAFLVPSVPTLMHVCMCLLFVGWGTCGVLGLVAPPIGQPSRSPGIVLASSYSPHPESCEPTPEVYPPPSCQLPSLWPWPLPGPGPPTGPSTPSCGKRGSRAYSPILSGKTRGSHTPCSCRHVLPVV